MTAILGSRRTTGARALPLLALLLGLVVVRQASADLNADFDRCRASIIQIGEHPRTADEAYCLGLCYQFAINRKRDSAKALEWLRRAANQRQAGAQAVLGYMLEQGIGAGRDPVQAFQWYQRSAQAGSDDGLVNLGRAYESGIGTARDVAWARGYHERAAAMGSEPARQALANLGARRRRRWAAWFRCESRRRRGFVNGIPARRRTVQGGALRGGRRPVPGVRGTRARAVSAPDRLSIRVWRGSAAQSGARGAVVPARGGAGRRARAEQLRQLLRERHRCRRELGRVVSLASAQRQAEQCAGLVRCRSCLPVWHRRAAGPGRSDPLVRSRRRRDSHRNHAA
ncbi:MAG: sel1 repeat family protein [Gammaproteobacteria bacterium]|nr:sel1 repeat family protein [Gammaproteobacteria bacterium]